MLMLALPMCLFYEASIVIGRLLERRKRTAAAAS
jgi:Sec-independent protein secretion pathway component TatC